MDENNEILSESNHSINEKECMKEAFFIILAWMKKMKKKKEKKVKTQEASLKIIIYN